VFKENAHPAWHMKRALRLAEEAKGWTLPNPMVGAVILNKDGERIGDGYHTKFGEAHAEIEALKSCTESPEGGTLYVTLEPCCHQGKTPPCTKAIIASGIRKVVVAVKDPSEKVAGQGIEELRAAGIEVTVGLLEKEARELNRFFFTFHEQKRPYITLKAAVSLDGKISGAAGTQTSLTGKHAQRYVHSLRHEHQAILVGAGTVLTDNPHLGVRAVEGRDPLRVILAGSRALPSDAQIFRDENVLVLKEKTIKAVLKKLHAAGVVSVLVEGGHEVFQSFIDAKMVDELQVFIAPILLGKKALPFLECKKELQLRQVRYKVLGKDLLLQAVPEFVANKQMNDEVTEAAEDELQDPTVNE